MFLLMLQVMKCQDEEAVLVFDSRNVVLALNHVSVSRLWYLRC